MKLYHKKYEYDCSIGLHAKTMYAWIQDKKGIIIFSIIADD